jgi:hypothetical protein
MATGNTTRGGSVGASSVQLVEYEQFIDQHVRRTGGQVRAFDAAFALLMLATATLLYFFTLALIDHWLVSGGLPVWARVTAFAGYLAVVGWYTATQVLPLFIRRINPLYAAETIERSQPTLKNSLLSFLQFRGGKQPLPEPVYHAIERQAATGLARAPVESAVDRMPLIRLGYVLAGVLALGAIYKIASPKDPFRTVARVLMPWADILPPTRVSIEQIAPGSSKVLRGERVEVTAVIKGLPRDESARLIYSTADGQITDRAVEMFMPDGGYRHTCTLMPDKSGVQQTLRYFLVAGDAKSRVYTLSVVAAPTIVVERVEYHFPSYTGLASQVVQHQGDIKGLEGTRVTIYAVTNQPLASGALDFNCDGHDDLPLQVAGTGELAQRATVSFTLGLEADRFTPRQSNYQLLFKNSEGAQNQQPIRHTIGVLADVPPEIEFIAPKKAELVLREGEALPYELVASDPDFSLSQVKLVVARDGHKRREEKLLNEPWQGQFLHKSRLRTKALGLKAGDVVEFWAEAADNKSPAPQVVETIKRKIRIVSADGGDPNAQADQDQNQPSDGEPDEQQQPQASKGGPNDRQQPGDQPKDPNDAQQQNQPGDNNPAEGQNAGEDPTGDQPPQPQDANQKSPADGEQMNDKGGNDAADKGDDPGKSQEGAQQSGEQQDPSAGQQQGDKGEAGKTADQPDAAPGEQQGGDQADDAAPQPVPNDGSTDGDALEKILQHREQQQGEQQGNQPNQQQPQGGKQPEGDQQSGKQPGDQQGPSDQPGGEQSGGQQGGGEMKQPQQPGGKSKPDNKQTGGQDRGGEEKPTDAPKQPGGEEDDSAGTGEENKMEEGPSDGAPSDRQQPGGGQQGGQAEERPTDQSSDKTGGQNNQPFKAADKPVSENAKEEFGESDGKGKSQPGKKQPGEKAQGKTPSQDKPSEDTGQGESGKGKSGGQQGGSPEAQGDNKPTNKTPKPSAGPQDDEGKQEAQSPSGSNRQSDSDSDSEGDRSGGGKQGGGQKANQPGAGGAGKNTAADDGAGMSEEQGTGEAGEKGGTQQETDQKTGQQGSESGQGSGQRPGQSAGKGESGEQTSQQNRPPGQQDPNAPEQGQPGAAGDGSARGAAQQPGQGQPGDRSQQGGAGESADPVSAPASEPGGDAANLEYARKATDLALEHLRDQLEKGEPDQKLLDELGWSRDDLQKFLQRWETMKQRAETANDKSERRELDATLRSLGLQPRGTTLSGNRTAQDTQRGLKESRRTSPPLEYLEQYRAYTQGTARGGK